MSFPESASRVATEDWPLEKFLRPTYQRLAIDPDFQQLLRSNQSALHLIDDVKASLAERVRQPKQISDLIDTLF
jgi:hypothetical protein